MFFGGEEGLWWWLGQEDAWTGGSAAVFWAGSLPALPLLPLLGERILDRGENTSGISGLKGEPRSELLKQLHTAAQ